MHRPNVVELGLRAANAIGDGFYGVDIKELDGGCVVIEVNDNPSVERGVEDAVLGDLLYDADHAGLSRASRGGPR